MTRFQTVAAVLAALIIIGAIPAFGADFYETQLRLGAESFRAGRLPEAIDYLRIANFGLLDRTELLAEGLARLAMAESAAGRNEDLQKTLTRFLAIELQYPAWTKAALTPVERAAFEALLLASLPKDAIVSVPSFAHLAVPASREETELTPDERRRHFERKAAAEPSNPEWPLELARDARARRDDRAALKWTGKALRADSGSVEAHTIRLAIFTLRKDDSKALGELRALPDSAWAAFPGIVPDAYVVYVRSKNDSQAGLLEMRLSAADLQRADVAGAIKALRERNAVSAAAVDAAQAARVEAAPAELPAAVAAQPSISPSVPEATPVVGVSDSVDTRSESSRGSFTGAQDRIGAALSSAKKLIAANRPADAQRALRDELAKTPGSRELRLAMLEASCLARDWRTGDAQIALVEPFRAGEDRYRFYAAVVLFESGKPEPAKPLMAEAAPRLSPSPFVDHYVKVVLGR